MKELTVLILAVIMLAHPALAQEVAEKSTEELARELANPNTPLTSLKLKIQYRTFKGDLPNADDQDGTTFLLQPTLPFPLASGKTLYVRPGISLKADQPVYKPADMGFDSGSGLGDFTIDVQYGDTNESGFLWSVGATTTIPTATESELGGDRWGLGPGFQLGRIAEKSVLGGFLNHQWDLGGSGDKRIDLTTLQLFGVYLPGGGWSIASSPIMNYDFENNEWTLPLNFAVGKTVKIKGRPWKFAMELNHYLVQPDTFGPEWMIGFNIAPVVENKLADWIR